LEKRLTLDASKPRFSMNSKPRSREEFFKNYHLMHVKE
jgi:hypothetical protein